MNNFKVVLLMIVCISTFCAGSVFAQKKAEMIATKRANGEIRADGLLTDWSDSLSLYNEPTRLYYSLANDDKNIYLALRSATKDDVAKILAGGISFSANIDVRKKDNPTVIFPVLDRTPGKPRSRDEEPERADIQKEILSRIKDIKVTGFKDIIDGGISLQNTYGIRAGASYDDKDNLVQEIIIPLGLLGLNAATAGEVTYLVRVNGLQGRMAALPQRQTVQRQRVPPTGMYGSSYPPKNHPAFKIFATTEFYIKSRLTTN